MLSTAELTRMRADVARMLPDSAAIYSPNPSVDGAGNVVPGVTLVATVACRLDPKGAQVENPQAGMQEKLPSLYILTVPYNTDLSKNYQIIINSKTYEIVELHEDHSWRVSKRATVVYVE